MRYNSDWVHVGDIGVDAGIVMVGDPCYHLHKEGENRYAEFGNDWHEFCDILYEPNGLDSNQAAQIGKSLAVVVSSGYGDGCYPVYVRRNRDGVVAEVKVVFDGPELGEDDES